MKRDLDIIRGLLQLIAESRFDSAVTGPNTPWRVARIDGASRKEVAYHMRLLLEAGFLHAPSVIESAQDYNGNSISKFLPDALTSAGNDYLGSISDQTIWNNTKQRAEEAGVFSLDMVKAIAKGFIKKKILELTDIEIDV